MAILRNLPKHFLCLLLSHVIYDVSYMLGNLSSSRLIGNQTKGSSSRSFYTLPGTRAENPCPCHYCSHKTYCQAMNHSIIPVGLPRRGVNTLHLFNNQLTELYGNEFRGMRELRLLTLYQNKITRINKNAFAGLINLDSLHLEFNQIKFIFDGTFKQLPKLRLLYLNNNKLTRYPGDLAFMKTLTKLNVNNNNIKKIHWTSFINLSKLRNLNLWNNTLKCDCNTKQLIKWLSATPRGNKIITGLPPDECVKNDSKSTKCSPIKIKKIVYNEKGGNVFTYNKTAVMQCIVGKDLMPVWVTPAGTTVLPYSTGRLTAFLNGTLEIRDVGKVDSGTYTCYAKYADDARFKHMTATLIVTRATKPNVLPPYAEVQVIKGDAVTLNCLANGIPPPFITWFAPTQPTKSNLSTSNRLIQTGKTLEIKRILMEDDGVWKCRVSNEKGYDVGRRKVTVNTVTSNTTLIVMATIVGGSVAFVAIATACAFQKVKKLRNRNKITRKQKRSKLTDGKATSNNSKKKENCKNSRTTKKSSSESNADRVIESKTVSSLLQQPYEREAKPKGVRL